MLASRQLAARGAAAWAQASRALAAPAGDAVVNADNVKLARELATTKHQADPTVALPGQAFVGDLRSVSGLCVGDGLGNHTSKWAQLELGGVQTTPMEFVQASAPIKVHGLVVASYGSDDPALGCPAEYIDLRGSTAEAPAVCKYTGNRYYSLDWKEGGHH
jgi:NADH dehydrogenase (ubiquinone) Fe-S protein 6